MSDEPTQADISAEIGGAHRDADGRPARHPSRDFPPYRSSALRHPTHELVRVDPEEIELAAPAFGHVDVDPYENDLTDRKSVV